LSDFSGVLARHPHRLGRDLPPVQLMVFDNWLREYQVLPNRTHPHVNMAATGGYLLAGIKVLTDHPLKAPATPKQPLSSCPSITPPPDNLSGGF